MTIFKVADGWFEALGFEKKSDTLIEVRYEKDCPNFNYTHVISIKHALNGVVIVQSYDKHGVIPGRYYDKILVGITTNELKAITRKIKEKGWDK